MKFLFVNKIWVKECLFLLEVIVIINVKFVLGKFFCSVFVSVIVEFFVCVGGKVGYSY